nr:hypothetical protein [Cohnella thermotolerans]
MRHAAAAKPKLVIEQQRGGDERDEMGSLHAERGGLEGRSDEAVGRRQLAQGGPADPGDLVGHSGIGEALQRFANVFAVLRFVPK